MGDVYIHGTSFFVFMMIFAGNNNFANMSDLGFVHPYCQQWIFGNMVFYIIAVMLNGIAGMIIGKSTMGCCDCLIGMLNTALIVYGFLGIDACVNERMLEAAKHPKYDGIWYIAIAMICLRLSYLACCLILCMTICCGVMCLVSYHKAGTDPKVPLKKMRQSYAAANLPGVAMYLDN